MLTPNLREELFVTEMHAELLRKLIAAVNRIATVEPPVGSTVHVKCLDSTVLKIRIWSVTSQYSIDASGNVLGQCYDPNSPKVTHEIIRKPSIGLMGTKALCDHLDEFCPITP